MGAVAAGLVLATALKLLPTLRKNPVGVVPALLIALLAFGAIAIQRLPLVWAVFGLGRPGHAAGSLPPAQGRAGMSAASFSAADYLDLFLQFLILSLLSIGGAISTAPEMHRFLVLQKGWLDETQFTSSIALAQAAPGPNILFVAVLGWNTAGWLGALVAMLGIMLPSTTLVLAATRWAEANRSSMVVRSFTAGMAPLTLGLLVATGWLLAQPYVAVAGTPLEHRGPDPADRAGRAQDTPEPGVDGAGWRAAGSAGLGVNVPPGPELSFELSWRPRAASALFRSEDLVARVAQARDDVAMLVEDGCRSQPSSSGPRGEPCRAPPRPRGAATSTRARMSLQPRALSRSTVAIIEPAVASMGSMISAVRSSSWPTKRSK